MQFEPGWVKWARHQSTHETMVRVVRGSSRVSTEALGTRAKDRVAKRRKVKVKNLAMVGGWLVDWEVDLVDKI